MSRFEHEKVHKVGFISPPAWFDITPMEFASIAPDNVLITQTLMRPHDFDYSLEHIKEAVPELARCVLSLSAAGADVVAQFGFPFSFVHGWPAAQQVQDSIGQEAGTQLVMMGVEAIHSLQHLGCKTIAVAATYYSEGPAQRLLSYLAKAEIDVSLCQTWQDQGLVARTDGGTFVGQGELDPMGWKTPEWAVAEAVRRVAAEAKDADCVLVTGGGMRLLHMADALEKETGKTIVAGDLALYWGILRRLGITTRVAGHGRLLDSLNN